jgi:hypothetical protein
MRSGDATKPPGLFAGVAPLTPTAGGHCPATPPVNWWGNFLRTLATPEPIKDWSLTSLKDKLIKIGAKVQVGPLAHQRSSA